MVGLWITHTNAYVLELQRGDNVERNTWRHLKVSDSDVGLTEAVIGYFMAGVQPARRKDWSKYRPGAPQGMQPNLARVIAHGLSDLRECAETDSRRSDSYFTHT